MTDIERARLMREIDALAREISVVDARPRYAWVDGVFYDFGPQPTPPGEDEPAEPPK